MLDAEKYDASAQAGPGFWRDLAGRILYFWWQVLVLLVVAVLAFGAAAWGGYTLVSRHVKSSEVRVPNLLGYPLDEAVEFLHANKTNLAIQIEESRYSDDTEEGEILSQHPGSNTFAKVGTIVRVVVSRGTSRVECPDVRGIEHLEAGIRLRERDLVEGKKTFMHDESVESDLVIEQTPAAGSPLLRGTEVNMLVSLGRPEGLYLMPNVLNTPIAQARALLSNIGFNNVSVDEGSFPGKSDNVVFRSNPAPGSVIALDAPIKLTVVKN